MVRVEIKGLMWLSSGLESQPRGLQIGPESSGEQRGNVLHMNLSVDLTQCGRQSQRGQFKAVKTAEVVKVSLEKSFEAGPPVLSDL